jgi:serine/threonine-protein kinase
MTEFIVFFFLFGVPGIVVLSWLRFRHERRMKELEVQRLRFAPPSTPPPPLLPNPEVEQRLRNLESIVCSVDYELNAKLNRLASRQLQVPASTPELAETAALSVGSVEPGSRVAGRFVVERRLGEGGMGAVYLARDEQLGEMVALKMIAGAALLDPAAAARFRREASAARRISHPNVVRLHDIGEEQGMLFLSMEYIAGTSMAQMLARHGRVEAAQLRPWVAQICSGLEAAHQVGVVHRDLKPGNILIDETQRVKIIDFGLARLPHIEGMTATGMILGTPEYMSPEQIRGRNVDARSDIYSLGAVIYHALVGKPPFSGDSPIAVGFAHCNDPLKPPRSERADVPEAWSSLVARAMSKDPSSRFDSAAELAAALPSA